MPVIVSAVAACMFLAAFLRLVNISDKSLWGDEVVTAAFTRLDWYNLARILWDREGNMSLYYLLLRAWSHLGNSEAVLRGFSALFSVATIPVIYLLGRRLFSPPTGVVAAFLWAANAYSVRYAQEARSYSMVAFLVTLAAYFLVRAVQSGEKRKARSSWTWHIVFSTLAVYAHFFAILAVIAHVSAFWRTEHKQKVNSAARRGAFFTLPVWIFIATTGAGPLRWVPRTTLTELWSAAVQYAGNAGWPLVLLYIFGVVLAICMRRGDRNLMLLGSWFLVPITIALIFSLARPVFVPRYFIIGVPALVLVVAAGITALRPSWLAVSLLAVTCWFAVSGIRSYYRADFDTDREDFRSATAYILSRSQPSDAIVFHRVFNRFGYNYYADRTPSTTRPAILYPGTEKPVWRDFVARVTPETLQAIDAHKGRVWIVATQDVSAADATVIENLKESAAHTRRLAYAKDFAFLRVYLYR